MKCKTLKISKLLCCKPLISTYLLIYSLDGTTIDTKIYKYFHLKFLPSPWKISLCLAAVVKSREEMKHWEKLFFTEATEWHPHRPHGLNHPFSQAETGGHRKPNHPLAQALQGHPCLCPSLGPQDEDLKTTGTDLLQQVKVQLRVISLFFKHCEHNSRI